MFNPVYGLVILELLQKAEQPQELYDEIRLRNLQGLNIAWSVGARPDDSGIYRNSPSGEPLIPWVLSHPVDYLVVQWSCDVFTQSASIETGISLLEDGRYCCATGESFPLGSNPTIVLPSAISQVLPSPSAVAHEAGSAVFTRIRSPLWLRAEASLCMRSLSNRHIVRLYVDSHTEVPTLKEFLEFKRLLLREAVARTFSSGAVVNKPPKGLILVSAAKEFVGGSGKSFRHLGEALQSMGEELVVVSGERGGSIERWAMERDLPTYSVPTWLGPHPDVREMQHYLNGLRDLVARHRPRAIILNTMQSGQVVLSESAAGAPVVVRILSSPSMRDLQEVKLWNADAIVVPSLSLAREMAAVGCRDATVISEWIPDDWVRCAQSKKDARTQQNFSQRFVVGVVARVDDPKKRVIDSITILRSLALDNPNALMIVVGDTQGNFRSVSSKFTLMARQMGIGPANLQFLGAQTDMRKIYSVMDLLLSSSVSEGFGLAIVEAAACGVPVLARYCGGVTDDLMAECELAVAQDTRTLTQRALEVMHSSGLRRKLARQCWLWSRKYIGSQNSLNKYRDMLEALS